MEKTSKWAGAFDFSNGIVKSGSKVSGYANPTLVISPTKDQFTLDSKACSLIGVGVGDKVLLADMCFVNGEVNTDLANRFFITKGYKVDGVEQGAILGKTRSFSYGKVWGAMLNHEAGVNEIRSTELVKAGILIQQGKAYISLKKGTAEVVPCVDEDGAPVMYEFVEGQPQPMFSLTNFGFSAHDPKTQSASTEE